jgi:hypothetical protein
MAEKEVAAERADGAEQPQHGGTEKRTLTDPCSPLKTARNTGSEFWHRAENTIEEAAAKDLVGVRRRHPWGDPWKKSRHVPAVLGVGFTESGPQERLLEERDVCRVEAEKDPGPGSVRP